MPDQPPPPSFPWLRDVLNCHRDLENLERNQIVLQLMRHDKMQRGTLPPPTKPIVSKSSERGSSAYLLFYPGRLSVLGAVSPPERRLELPPVLTTDCTAEISCDATDTAQLLRELVHEYRPQVDLLQAVLHLGSMSAEKQSWSRECFQLAGLTQLTCLAQFELPVSAQAAGLELRGDSDKGCEQRETIPSTPKSTDIWRTNAGEIRFVEWEDELTPRLCATVERTYKATLDVPELDGYRSTPDTLHGYLASSPASEPKWWLVQWRPIIQETEETSNDHIHPAESSFQDCGCLLTSVHDETTLEVVYLGVVPELRGRKIGSLLLQFLSDYCLANRIERVLLAVDLRNSPAIKIYEKFGFKKIGEAEVWYAK